MNKLTVERWLLDARVWILVLLFVRLYHIDLPPYDVHAFRQTLTLGAARCFAEIDPNIFSPRTILCDSRPGYDITEFPALNYSIFLLWKVFGEHNWCYRLLVLLLSSAGLWYFYKILRRYADERAALASMVFFGVSISFMYARKAMPDMFSLSLVLIGLGIGWDFLEKGKWWRWLVFTVLVALGLLSKIPSAKVGVFLIFPLLDPKIALRSKIWVMLGGILALAAMSGWYFYWIPWAEKEYGHQWFFRLPFEQAWNELFYEASVETNERFYPIAMQNRLASWLVIFGLVAAFWEKKWKILLSFGVSSAIFLCFIFQVGKVFSHHEYYIIPFVPAMALAAGYGLSVLTRHNWVFIGLLAFLTTFNIYYFFQKEDEFFIPPVCQKFTKLEAIAREHTEPNSRVLVLTHPTHHPVMMYAAHKRGWIQNDNQQAKNPVWMDGESTVGLHYALVDKSNFKDALPYPVLFEDQDFIVYKIKK